VWIISSFEDRSSKIVQLNYIYNSSCMEARVFSHAGIDPNEDLTKSMVSLTARFSRRNMIVSPHRAMTCVSVLENVNSSWHAFTSSTSRSLRVKLHAPLGETSSSGVMPYDTGRSWQDGRPDIINLVTACNDSIFCIQGFA